MVEGYTTKQDECASKRFYEFLTEGRKIQELVRKDMEIDRLNEQLKQVNGVETSQDKALNLAGVNVRFDSELRDKFFKECVSSRTVKDSTGTCTDYHQWIDIAPHDLFEWFKRNAR